MRGFRHSTGNCGGTGAGHGLRPPFSAVPWFRRSVRAARERGTGPVAVNRVAVLRVMLLRASARLPRTVRFSGDEGMWCPMGGSIRMAGRGVLAAAVAAGLAGLGVAVPAVASPGTVPGVGLSRPARGAAGPVQAAVSRVSAARAGDGRCAVLAGGVLLAAGLLAPAPGLAVGSPAALRGMHVFGWVPGCRHLGRHPCLGGEQLRQLGHRAQRQDRRPGQGDLRPAVQVQRSLCHRRGPHPCLGGELRRSVRHRVPGQVSPSRIFLT